MRNRNYIPEILAAQEIPSVSRLLDKFKGAEAAFSLERLKSGFNPPVIRVRRDSDDAEQDIGFDGDSLDEQGLLDFANGGDVDVARWHDQSDTDVDVEQSTLSSQPRIVNGGTVESVDGRTAMHFDSSQNQYLINSSHPFASETFTALTWVYLSSANYNNLNAIDKGDFNNSNRNLVIFIDGDRSNQVAARFNDTGGSTNSVYGSTSLSTGTWYFIATKYDKSEFVVFLDGSRDGSSSESSTPVTDNTSPLVVGSIAAGSAGYFDGYIRMPLLFPRALSDSEIQDIYNRTK